MDDSKLRIKALEEMIQVVLVAIPTEITAQQMYMKAAGKAVNDESRELFLALTEQERAHERQLKLILQDLQYELDRLKTG